MQELSYLGFAEVHGFMVGLCTSGSNLRVPAYSTGSKVPGMVL